jgi:hypothetical protein
VRGDVDSAAGGRRATGGAGGVESKKNVVELKANLHGSGGVRWRRSHAPPIAQSIAR